MRDDLEFPEFRYRWHLARVIVPRRSISGKLIWGLVWRRFDGRKWLYRDWRLPFAASTFWVDLVLARTPQYFL